MFLFHRINSSKSYIECYFGLKKIKFSYPSHKEDAIKKNCIVFNGFMDFSFQPKYLKSKSGVFSKIVVKSKHLAILLKL
jgi:hypothetical protein